MIDLEKIRKRRAAIGEADWSFHLGTIPTTHATVYYDPEKCPLILQGDRMDGIARFIAHAPGDIDALVAEVERLRRERDEACYAASHWEAETTSAITRESGLRSRLKQIKSGDLQSCGHPRSARVSAAYMGPRIGTSYCGMCNAEAEAKVRRDDAIGTTLDSHSPKRHEPYSGDLDMDPDVREQMERY